ncbi:N-6 DNA methylase [Dyadobacter helix]|nr:N-6 DNA methylase [Dyadobacter sp. CECT 9275]
MIGWKRLVQLPNNLFTNTGITTYIWILSNNKAPHRQGKSAAY